MALTFLYRIDGGEIDSVSVDPSAYDAADMEFFAILTDPPTPDGTSLDPPKKWDGTNVRDATGAEITAFAQAEADYDALMDLRDAKRLLESDAVTGRALRAILMVLSRPEPLTQGLQIALDMDSLTPSGLMADLSGQGNHGTIVGTLPDVAGKRGRARDFTDMPPGPPNQITVPDDPSISGLSALTMHVRINPDDLSDGGTDANTIQGIVTKGERAAGSLAQTEYSLHIDRRTANRDVTFLVTDGVIATSASFSINKLAEGTWADLMCVWDSVRAGPDRGKALIYLDGGLKDTAPDAVFTMNNTGQKLRISSGTVSAPRFFDGQINRFHLYNLLHSPLDFEKVTDKRVMSQSERLQTVLAVIDSGAAD